MLCTHWTFDAAPTVGELAATSLTAEADAIRQKDQRVGGGMHPVNAHLIPIRFASATTIHGFPASAEPPLLDRAIRGGLRG